MTFNERRWRPLFLSGFLGLLLGCGPSPTPVLHHSAVGPAIPSALLPPPAVERPAVSDDLPRPTLPAATGGDQPPESTAPKSGDRTAVERSPDEGAMAGGAAAEPVAAEPIAEMRGHPCQCGKTCHCGHCSAAVPGCHCHVKRSDDPEPSAH